MSKLTQNVAEGNRFIEINNPQNTIKATLCLTQGGRLSGLTFNGTDILAEYPISTYKANYASAILFPFANRIKDGQYTFDGVDYRLSCNESDKNNALHGLVYNKTFEYVDQKLSADAAAVTLRYQHHHSDGFPFKFDILLTYLLSENQVELSVDIINKDNKRFPFSLGWHPYFSSKNLDRSTLDFQSDTMYLCDEQQIVSGTKSFEIDMFQSLEALKFDDGYKLESDGIRFSTPEYQLKISSTGRDNYLQLYTPATPNIIAIEPMTAAADCFNNQIGLQTLAPEAHYNIKWALAFEDHKNHNTTNT